MSPVTKMLLLASLALTVFTLAIEWMWGRSAVLWFLAIFMFVVVGLERVDRIRNDKRQDGTHVGDLEAEPTPITGDEDIDAALEVIRRERVWTFRIWVLIEWTLCAALSLTGLLGVVIARGETLSWDMPVTGWHGLAFLIGIIAFLGLRGRLWAFVVEKYRH